MKTTKAVRLDVRAVKRALRLPKDAWVRFSRYPRTAAPPEKFIIVTREAKGRLTEVVYDETAIKKAARAPAGATVSMGHHRTTPGFLPAREFMVIVSWSE